MRIKNEGTKKRTDKQSDDSDPLYPVWGTNEERQTDRQTDRQTNREK